MDGKSFLRIPRFLGPPGWLLAILLSGNVLLYRVLFESWNLFLIIYTGLCLVVLFIFFNKIKEYFSIIHSTLKKLGDYGFDPDQSGVIHSEDPLIIDLYHLHRKNQEILSKLRAVFKDDSNLSFDYLGEEDVFRNLITEIRNELKTQKQEEKIRNWTVEGLASFGELIRNKEDDLSNLGKVLLHRLVQYNNCNQGAIFVTNADSEGNVMMKCLSSYAHERNRSGEMIVDAGDGLLGRCMLEKETILLKEVPDNYVNITSGLGSATPTNIVIIPLLANESFYGVIELASFEMLEQYQISFLEKLAENIALSIASFQNKKHTQQLLDESRKLSSELQEKELKMQENMEKLISAKEEMRFHQMELDGLFRAINSCLVTAEIDMEGKIMGSNKNLLQLFGYRYEEVVGMSVSQLLNDEEILSDRFNKILNKGNTFSKDILCYTKDTQPFWLRVSFTPVEDVSGEIYKILMLGEDVTEKKLKEVELQSHMQAIDKTIAAIEFNMKGEVQRVNPIYLGITGYKPDELVGNDYAILLPDEDKNNPQSMLLWESLQNGQFFSGVFKHIDKQGKEQWLNGTFNPIFDLNGQPQKVMMFADFVTEAKEKQNELQGMVKAMKGSIPYLEIDANANFKTANKLFFEVFGYKRLELQKKDLGKLLSPASFKKFSEIVKTISENTFSEGEFDWITAGGKSFGCKVTLSAINNLENQLDKIILMFAFSETK